MRRVALALAVAASLTLAPAAVAHAAPSPTIIEGEVIRLVSVQDTAAMAAMTPGTPVVWDVRVSASEPDGRVELALEAETSVDGYEARVRSCSLEWVDGACPGESATLLDAPLVDGVVQLATQAAADARWYRIEVELTDFLGGARADLVFRAAGAGETVSTGGEAVLPQTGSEAALGAALALVAIAMGLTVALLASVRRRGATR